MLKHANNKLLWGGGGENPAIYQTHVERLPSNERCCIACIPQRDLRARLSCSENLIFILKDRRAGRNAMSSVTYCICWERGYYSKEAHRLGSDIRLSWPMGKNLQSRDQKMKLAYLRCTFFISVTGTYNYFNAINNMKLLEFNCMK